VRFVTVRELSSRTPSVMTHLGTALGGQAPSARAGAGAPNTVNSNPASRMAPGEQKPQQLGSGMIGVAGLVLVGASAAALLLLLCVK